MRKVKLKIILNKGLSKFICCFVLIFHICCSKHDDNLDVRGISNEKMVLFYIAANNDLHIDAIESLKKIKEGYHFTPEHKVLVYLKTRNDVSHLLALGENKIDTVVTYLEENSSSSDFMQKVISDAEIVSMMKTSGLVLWSHATSWKPALKLKSFGLDQGREMDIKELAQSLPENLEFIVFDACTMASMEVLYELRKKAKYILASPSEILSSSFPYDNSINLFFMGVEGLKSVAQNFLSYYQNQNGLYQSATISLIQMSNLYAIAIETKKLLESNARINPYNISKVQQLTFDTSNNVVSYDFSSFLKNNYEYSAYSELDKAMQKAVLLKGHTKYFLGHEIVEYCGLTIYIPEPKDPYSDYYNSLQWNTDSKWRDIFNQN